ncbi:MAG: helix-turn-helix domain-containing protein [Aphanocapsa sp. GSE-SYN-MK-11-07L]|nr:helix-turn-helix domain-containing protein [Aphanocapsa sp. GSE-SYN-MK-11-07L]
MENQGHCLTSFQRKLLLKSLQADLRPEYRRRIEIMLMADQGQSQSQICAALNCSQETSRYWIYMAEVGQAHQWSDRPMGRPKAVNDDYLNRLRELVSQSPREYGYSFRLWTARWLSRHLAQETGIEVSDRHINRLLKDMGLSTRQKNNSVTEAVNSPECNDSNIAIHDLGSSSSSNLLWPLNLIQTSH